MSHHSMIDYSACYRHGGANVHYGLLSSNTCMVVCVARSHCDVYVRLEVALVSYCERCACVCVQYANVLLVTGRYLHSV